MKSSSQLLFEWLFVGEKLFTEPFFGDTISACRTFVENNSRFKIVSDSEMMVAWAKEMHAVSPSAIIFHVSRCGSTLLSQLLSCDSRHIVLSEVPLFDEILRLPFIVEPACATTVHRYLDAAVRFYGQRRVHNQEYLFIKTDSWHLHFYEQLRSLYPDIPFLFFIVTLPKLYIHRKGSPGLQFVPGTIEPEVFGLSNEPGSEVNLPLYRANVLDSYFKKMIQIMETDSLAFSFDYAEGMLNIIKRVYSLLHLQ